MATASLFCELSKQLERENFAKAIELCNKVLVHVSNDRDALKIKCVCLIRLNKFEKAYDIALNNNALVYELAYCLYRMKRLENALHVLDSVPDSKAESVLALKAQILYRQNEYDQCIDMFQELNNKNTNEVNGPEIKANLVASFTASGRGNEALGKADTPETYEVVYNRGCAYIQQCNWRQAERELKRSEEMCRASLSDEGFSEDDILLELGLIRVQLAYVYHMSGDAKKAHDAYLPFLKSTDATLLAVATNNFVVLRGDKDVFDSYKRIRSINLDKDADRLTAQQREAIYTNRALLLCLMNKGRECRAEVEMLKSVFQNSSHWQKIMSALLIREKNYDGCMKFLQNFPCSISNQLMQAKVRASQGQFEKAKLLLQSLPSIKNRPGVVATLLDLNTCVQDSLLLLDNAINSYDAGHGPEGLRTLREGDACFKLRNGLYRDAADALEALLASYTPNSEDHTRCLALLIIALSHIEPERAETHSTMLPLVEDESVVRAEEYESIAACLAKTRVSRMISKIADSDTKKRERKRQAKKPEQVAKKRARKREKYLSMLMSKEDYNPSIGLVRPDPERWIPRKQRSYSKRGRRGRGKFVGAQGSGMGGLKDSMKLDAAARTAHELPDHTKGVVSENKASVSQRKARKKKRR